MPAGIATNDILILVANGGFSTVPAQWTLLFSWLGENTNNVYWLRYDGSQTAQAVTWSAGNMSARVFAFRGCVTSGVPSSANNGNDLVAATTAFTVGAITVASGSAVVYGAFVIGGSSSTTRYSGWSTTKTGAMTELGDNTNLTGSVTSIGLAWGLAPSAGSTGTQVCTVSGASPGDTIIFDLLAAGAVVPIPQLPRMVRQAVARAASY